MCPFCAGVVDVTSPHVAVQDSAIRTFCSADCLGQALAGGTKETTLPPRRRRGVYLGVGLGLAGLAALPLLTRPRAEPVMQRITATPAPPAPSAAAATGAPAFSDADREREWVAELAKDSWIHPLRGVRRMPIGHEAVFGAERPGDRPVECVSGHCGVDLGGEVWGEPVVAVHDGVVERVQRGPNEDHGGQYVRIAHRGGTVYSQYFHLAAIPRWVQPGVQVKLGQVIGLLGDTGVKHSRQHLHFTLSVKAAPDKNERYIDPEPLIALWPLLVPENDETYAASSMVTDAPPGLPKRGEQRKKKKKKREDDESGESAPTAAAASSEGGGDDAGPPSTF